MPANRFQDLRWWYDPNALHSFTTVTAVTWRAGRWTGNYGCELSHWAPKIGKAACCKDDAWRLRRARHMTYRRIRAYHHARCIDRGDQIAPRQAIREVGATCQVFADSLYRGVFPGSVSREYDGCAIVDTSHGKIPPTRFRPFPKGGACPDVHNYNSLALLKKRLNRWGWARRDGNGGEKILGLRCSDWQNGCQVKQPLRDV